MESAETPPEGQPMSLGTRLINVFAAPGELFAAVAASRFSLANWLVPAFLVGLVGAIAALVIFSQPALVQEVREMQDREIQKRVDAGKMPPEAAEQARQVMQGIGLTIMRVAAAVGAGVAAVVGPLWWGFVGWLVARLAFRAPLGYLRAVEVAGLASLVSILGALVGMFMAVGFGRLMAGPHLGVLVSEFDVSNRLHLALAAVNVFSLWQVALLGLGLSRLIQRPFVPVGVAVFAVWAGYKLIAVVLKLAQFAF